MKKSMKSRIVSVLIGMGGLLLGNSFRADAQFLAATPVTSTPVQATGQKNVQNTGTDVINWEDGILQATVWDGDTPGLGWRYGGLCSYTTDNLPLDFDYTDRLGKVHHLNSELVRDPDVVMGKVGNDIYALVVCLLPRDNDPDIYTPPGSESKTKPAGKSLVTPSPGVTTITPSTPGNYDVHILTFKFNTTTHQFQFNNPRSCGPYGLPNVANNPYTDYTTTEAYKSVKYLQGTCSSPNIDMNAAGQYAIVWTERWKCKFDLKIFGPGVRPTNLQGSPLTEFGVNGYGGGSHPFDSPDYGGGYWGATYTGGGVGSSAWGMNQNTTVESGNVFTVSGNLEALVANGDAATTHAPGDYITDSQWLGARKGRFTSGGSNVYEEAVGQPLIGNAYNYFFADFHASDVTVVDPGPFKAVAARVYVFVREDKPFGRPSVVDLQVVGEAFGDCYSCLSGGVWPNHRDNSNSPTLPFRIDRLNTTGYLTPAMATSVPRIASRNGSEHAIQQMKMYAAITWDYAEGSCDTATSHIFMNGLNYNYDVKRALAYTSSLDLTLAPSITRYVNKKPCITFNYNDMKEKVIVGWQVSGSPQLCQDFNIASVTVDNSEAKSGRFYSLVHSRTVGSQENVSVAGKIIAPLPPPNSGTFKYFDYGFSYSDGYPGNTVNTNLTSSLPSFETINENSTN